MATTYHGIIILCVSLKELDSDNMVDSKIIITQKEDVRVQNLALQTKDCKLCNLLNCCVSESEGLPGNKKNFVCVSPSLSHLLVRATETEIFERSSFSLRGSPSVLCVATDEVSLQIRST
jgi:hypothetical protein